MRLPTLDLQQDVKQAPHINQYIEHYFDCSLDDILSPIGDNQVGESVRHNGVYFRIKEARRMDDPNLPQGVWTHEMKTADWEVVEKTALDALCHKSKDLQLGVWLLESAIHRKGFAGIAPAAVVIRSLCEAYWESMYPEMVDGDIEFRTNPINWINEKLSLQLKLVPLTFAPLDGPELSLNDWETAQRYEQLKHQHEEEIDWQGTSSESFKQRLAATSVDFLQALQEQIDDAQQALEALSLWLDQQCGDNSPSLGDLSSLLKKIQTIAGDELNRRGIYAMASAPTDDTPGSPEGTLPAGGSGGSGSSGPINSRSDAFARLREAAAYLMEDDPHSPVPYLVNTACGWGQKSAPDLYQEIFLHKGGQLNIFELMGLSLNEAGTE